MVVAVVVALDQQTQVALAIHQLKAHLKEIMVVPVVGHQFFQGVAVVGQQLLEITIMHQPMLGTVEMAPLPVFLALLLLMQGVGAQQAIIRLLVLAVQEVVEVVQMALVILPYRER